MRIVQTIAELRAALRGAGPVNLVPTMGNLHAGHLSLVGAARGRGGMLVTSIFVNRLQFGANEDFGRYPRTLEQDCRLLRQAGCDIVFAPADEEMYPEPQEFRVLPAPALADILEGAVRPGFFTGVCTVVLKLLNLTQPQAAYFGRKDFQQLLVVRRMVQQLALPIEIVGCETVRDADGLALSSRNGYLDAASRPEAARLSRTLSAVAQALRAAHGSAAARRELEQEAMQSLSACGWLPEYIAVRRSADLAEPSPGDALVVLGAARIGGTRLIDNVEVGGR